ncbi:restriction endonuclease subunit S [Francisella tularensis]|uniref:restriction endonuclease subunit S n=1 Tax=Francisella tularensis TaxID=263 RepID=UPI001C0EBDDE|nr:restriction endonuclease subunit S [Francisella tularensis]MBK2109074.1 restriction endonuclease subunit S [Francisella tularensis subsp. novicida FSC595]
MQLTKMPKYDAYKDSGVEWLGEIPEGWNASRLGGEFLERKEKVSDKDYEPLSVTKLGIVPQLDNAAKTNDGDNRKLVKKGDFVINSRSDRKGSSGISYLDGSVSLINLVLKPITIKAPFCNYLLKSYAFIEEFYRNGHGIVADLWTTRYWDMKSIILPIPPTHEQTLIAKYLDQKTSQIDKAIEIKHKQIELLKEQKQIVINEAVTKGLDKDVEFKDSGIEWIGEIPQGWEVKKAKYIFTEINQRSETGSEELLSLSKYKGIIPKSSLEERAGLASTLVGYKKVFANTLVINKMQAVNGLLAVSNINGITSPDYSIYSTSSSKYNVHYYGYLLSRDIYLSEFKKVVTGVMEGFIRLYTDDLYNIKMIVPSTLDQQQIVAYIEEKTSKIDKAIELQHNQIDKLKEYKASLINSVVTGKVRVTDEMVEGV